MGVIMLPPYLIEQFWQKVQVLLESDHCLKRDRSREALSRYRKLVEAKVGDMIYHQEARDVAATIAAAVKAGRLLQSDCMNCQYSMKIQWSDEDQVYIVTVPEFGDFAKTHVSTYEEAAKNGHEVLDLLIETYKAEGRPLPKPAMKEAALKV